MRKKSQSKEYFAGLSDPQFLVLHVAANYRLRKSSAGWWADGYREDRHRRIHSPATIKSLLKRELLNGNARGKKNALEGWDGTSTNVPPIPLLWASEKGRRVLEEFDERMGVVFDRENYRLVEVANGGKRRHLDTEPQPAWANDPAGCDVETYFPSRQVIERAKSLGIRSDEPRVKRACVLQELYVDAIFRRAAAERAGVSTEAIDRHLDEIREEEERLWEDG
jgi:hypothetical protein